MATGMTNNSNSMSRLIAFLQSKAVLIDLGCQTSVSSNVEGGKEISVKIETVPCSILSTDIFDRIYERGIVLQDGTIRKCFEEYINDIVVADELRNMLLIKESDNYDLYSEKERAEFLFKIFQHICLGGSLNQYEDSINPYILTAKTLYKDVVCVRKTGIPKKITIMSKVFKVTAFIEDIPFFPTQKQHEQDFMYAVLNPLLKEITILHHVW
ncbi:cilia- and flagella-associated protein 300 [Caerostris darwini]|uniref:Cilia- and flagella-associated protein 300 n=1 Tax=Caerostris darwini TaxID=1538125 RepID=A0AAV4WG36_9ARAC|nr:cilia- and flagella-associated protein 300 [Caerostris darwini]